MSLTLQSYQEKGFNPEIIHGLCPKAEARFLSFLACLYLHNKNPRLEYFEISNLVYCAVRKYPIRIENHSKPFFFGATNYFIYKILTEDNTVLQQSGCVGVVNNTGQKLFGRPFVQERLDDCDLLTPEQQYFVTLSQSRISISNNQELFNILLEFVLGKSERSCV